VDKSQRGVVRVCTPPGGGRGVSAWVGRDGAAAGGRLRASLHRHRPRPAPVLRAAPRADRSPETDSLSGFPRCSSLKMAEMKASVLSRRCRLRAGLFFTVMLLSCAQERKARRDTKKPSARACRQGPAAGRVAAARSGGRRPRRRTCLPAATMSSRRRWVPATPSTVAFCSARGHAGRPGW
jgi:hypothetical protein